MIEHGFPRPELADLSPGALARRQCAQGASTAPTVVYADRFVPDDEKRRARETGEEATAIPFLKRFARLQRRPMRKTCRQRLRPSRHRRRRA